MIKSEWRAIETRAASAISATNELEDCIHSAGAFFLLFE